MNLMPNIHFAKNQLIFEEGYPADSVYLICEGAVEIFKKRHNEQLHIARLEKDSIFGEMALISDRPRSATVMSVDDTWCYVVTKDTFLQKLNVADASIIQVFNDLVETIRAKNNAATKANGQHSSLLNFEALDELALMQQENNMGSIQPEHSLEYVKHNQELLQKVEKMDLFMRQLFNSLVNIAYK
jgi:CRP-like cAMP-binding protein